MNNGEKFKEELIQLLNKYNAEIEAITETDVHGYLNTTYIELTLNRILDDTGKNILQDYEILNIGRYITK